MKKKQIAAFFDFDKTLLSCNSAKLGFQYLYDKGMFDLPFFLSTGFVYLFYKANLVTEKEMTKYVLRWYRGRDVTPLIRDAPFFYEKYIRPNIAPAILEKAKMHKKQGCVLVLISASLHYYLEPVANYLGFDHLLCTRLEIKENGTATGRTIGPIVVEEVKKELAEKLAGTENIDMENSFAYGNHQADIPLLKSVGHGFCVEPTGPLKKAASEHGWPVLKFR